MQFLLVDINIYILESIRAGEGGLAMKQLTERIEKMKAVFRDLVVF